MALAEGGRGQARERDAGESLRPLGFSSEPCGLGQLGKRDGKEGGESTAGGFVPAEGLRTLHEMEWGMGVSGAAGVGCPRCYWVREAGDSRITLPPAQRETSLRAAKVKSSAPWPPPRSGPVAAAAAGRRRTHNWLAASRF